MRSANEAIPGSGEAPGPTREVRSIDAVVARVNEISTLPSVALHVMEIAADPEAGATDLKSAVEADPALCVRVLRCVNSAAFGLRTQIENLSQAVSYLGFNQIRDLAVTATVSTLFKSGSSVATYQREGLWKHLVGTGVCARMIAARAKVRGFENAFLAGLLHDLGIILLDQNRNEDFRQIILSLTSSTTLPETEQKFLGWDHQELGALVAASWKLPPVVLVSMRHHHQPETYVGPHAPVLHCVALANLICSVKDLTSVGRNLIGLPRESLSALSLDKSDLEVFAEDLDKELESNQHLFDIQREA